MRQLLKELFYIPKHDTGKMREKAFLARIAVSVCIIVLCLSAMGISAYAWFAGSIVSSTNKIVAANYDLDWTITVTDSDGKAQTSVNTAILIGEDTDAPKTYSIHIEKRDTSTASTGFCILRVDFEDDGTVDETYHTVQIGEDTKLDIGERKALDFIIKLNQAARITFVPHWGTSSCYDAFSTDHYIKDQEENDEPVEIGTLQYQYTEQPDEPEEQPNANTTTGSNATTSSGDTSDAATSTASTTSTTSHTTPSTEQTTPTSNDTTSSVTATTTATTTTTITAPTTETSTEASTETTPSEESQTTESSQAETDDTAASETTATEETEEIA